MSPNTQTEQEQSEEVQVVVRQKKPKTTEQLMKEFAQRLADEENQRSGIERGGSTIRVPPTMDFEDAIRVLTDVQKHAEAEEQFHEFIECQPNDGLVAFNDAMNQEFGKVMGATIKTFFGDIPPQYVRVPVSHKHAVEVPVGKIQVPGLNIEIFIEPRNNPDPAQTGVVLHCKTKRKFLPLIRRIAAITKARLVTHSIYKGKAINNAFEFLDLEQFREDLVVFPNGVKEQMEANIWTPIKQAAACASNGINLKRGILMYGPYGTGKTLTGLITARRAVENGWTFINVKPGQDFRQALVTARRYQPAVVFVEDIDNATQGGRTGDLNQILETFDGLVTKSNQVMVILTTNHIEKIHRAMLRPGRLDALIEVKDYDKEALCRFIRIQAHDRSGQSLLEGELDEDRIFEAGRGFVPAFLTEAVGRAKLYAISRGADADNVRLVSEDIEAALVQMRLQWNIMNETAVVEKAPIDTHLTTLVSRVTEDAAKRAIAEYGQAPHGINPVAQAHAKKIAKEKATTGKQ